MIGLSSVNELYTRKGQTLTLNLSGFLEALDKAPSAMKNPKDIFYSVRVREMKEKGN